MSILFNGKEDAILKTKYDTVKAEDARTEADETKQTLLRVVRIDSDGLHVGDNQNLL